MKFRSLEVQLLRTDRTLAFRLLINARLAYSRCPSGITLILVILLSLSLLLHKIQLQYALQLVFLPFDCQMILQLIHHSGRDIIIGKLLEDLLSCSYLG